MQWIKISQWDHTTHYLNMFYKFWIVRGCHSDIRKTPNSKTKTSKTKKNITVFYILWRLQGFPNQHHTYKKSKMPLRVFPPHGHVFVCECFLHFLEFLPFLEKPQSIYIYIYKHHHSAATFDYNTHTGIHDDHIKPQHLPI